METTEKSNIEVDRSPLLYIAAGIASIGGFLFGYDTAVISGAILFIKKQFSLSSLMEEVIISALFLSATIGAPIGGILADRFGRRKILIFTGLTFALGTICLALSPNVIVLILSRLLVGTALGMVSVISPIYISEVSDVNRRGRLVSLVALGITFGTLSSYIIDYAFSGDQGWRWMFGIGSIPAIALAIGMFFMPETPRWLTGHSLIDMARSALIRIRGTLNIDDELESIKTSVGQHKGHWSELFSPAVRPALFLGIGLAFLRSFAAFSVILYGYSPTIFEFAGFKTASVAILATLGVGIVNTITTFVALTLVDRIGRRPLMLIGFIGMALSMGTLGIVFLFPEISKLKDLIALLSLMIYISSFAIGPRPVFWLLISEIYPSKIRGLAMSIGSLTNWATNWLATLTFLSLSQIIGRSETFWVYGIAGICAFLLVYFFVPETKGQSLEQIEDHWRSGKHPREMGK